jgi:hypothetical protein
MIIISIFIEGNQSHVQHSKGYHDDGDGDFDEISEYTTLSIILMTFNVIMRYFCYNHLHHQTQNNKIQR